MQNTTHLQTINMPSSSLLHTDKKIQSSYKLLLLPRLTLLQYHLYIIIYTVGFHLSSKFHVLRETMRRASFWCVVSRTSTGSSYWVLPLIVWQSVAVNFDWCTYAGSLTHTIPGTQCLSASEIDCIPHQLEGSLHGIHVNTQCSHYIAKGSVLYHPILAMCPSMG